MNTACLAACENSLRLTWKGAKILLPLSGFALLPHAGPHIGVDRIGSGHGFNRDHW